MVRGAIRDNRRCVRTRAPDRIALRLAVIWTALLLFAAPSALAAPDCGSGQASAARVGKPAAAVAWRAGLVARTRLWRSVPKRGARNRGTIGPREASGLLVLRAARDRKGRCWLRVRLPSRPNDAAAWIDADRVVLRPTRWRIVVARRARTISVFRDGKRLRRFRIVIGASRPPRPAASSPS